MTIVAGLQLEAIERVLAVPCPTCSSSGFARCTTSSGRELQAEHAKRRQAQAARAALERKAVSAELEAWTPPAVMELRDYHGRLVGRFTTGSRQAGGRRLLLRRSRCPGRRAARA